MAAMTKMEEKAIPFMVMVNGDDSSSDDGVLMMKEASDRSL